MNYNSIQFWILFGVILTTYWFANHRDQNRILLLGSYVFYGFWDYRFLCLILVSTIIDYIGGLGVAGRRVSKGTFWRLSLILMTVALCVAMPLKQMGSSFRNGNWNDIAHSMPRNLEAWAGPILVAVGIIFYAITLPWMYSLPEKSRRRVFLWVSMAANISILAFFKYFDFFIASGRDFAVWLGFGDLGWATFGIILPAGISFYTFQAMSYTIDIYRNECEPTEEFSDFALFVCFFPHLVAGPIMRAHTLLPQVINPRLMTRVKFVDGFYLILIGMFKKVVLADNLAPIADDLFFSFADGSADGRNFLDVLIGVYAFAWQIYGDFSGYSAVARGVSKWLGFELVINFDQPYLAVSPSDFWRRWHISLSTWLRDYLYIPVGGNRCRPTRLYFNLMLTMVLGGLWHGASWTFVSWGGYQGLLLCAWRYAGCREAKERDSFTQFLKWTLSVLIMFHITCFGWLLFRADSFGTIVQLLQTVLLKDTLSLSAFSSGAIFLVLFFAGPVLLLDAYLSGERRMERMSQGPELVQTAVITYLALMLLCFQAENPGAFIYFQF